MEKLESIKNQFPVLKEKIYGKRLAYLDNAATTLKPQIVIDAITEYYSKYSSNVHRGVHYLSEVSTQKYEETRSKLQEFINAKSRKEIIFTRGTTESINMISRLIENQTNEGDIILVSEMEHHSNIVPWQLLAQRKNIDLQTIPIDHNGDILLDEFKNLLNEKVKLISFPAISNALGTINPYKEMIKEARLKTKALVLLDGAQVMAHSPIDVQEIDCDFLAFSAHKIFGPTGLGVLYGKENVLETLPPFMGGGDMIDQVSFEETTFNDLPYRLEAGTPSIASVIGFGKSIDFIKSVGWDFIKDHEDKLLAYAQEELAKIPRLQTIGNPKKRAGVISFIIEGIHAQDLMPLVDQYGIAMRTGHHCTQPLMKKMGVSATSRISLSIYNGKEDINQFCQAINKAIEILG